MSKPKVKVIGSGLGKNDRTKVLMPDGREIPGIQSASVEIKAGMVAQLKLTIIDFEVDLDTERGPLPGSSDG